MKHLEDIAKMDEAALESAALGESIPIPEGLQERMEAGLLAEEEASEPARRRHFPFAPAALLAVAAAVAALVAIPRYRNAELRDTFNDPYLACAQMEETFRMISDKMNIGREAASSLSATAEKTRNIIKSINEK